MIKRKERFLIILINQASGMLGSCGRIKEQTAKHDSDEVDSGQDRVVPHKGAGKQSGRPPV